MVSPLKPCPIYRLRGVPSAIATTFGLCRRGNTIWLGTVAISATECSTSPLRGYPHRHHLRRAFLHPRSNVATPVSPCPECGSSATIYYQDRRPPNRCNDCGHVWRTQRRTEPYKVVWRRAEWRCEVADNPDDSCRVFVFLGTELVIDQP